MFILLLAYRHNSLCSSTTYRSNDHGCMSMIVNLPDVVPQHPCPTLIYCALVQYSVSATGGFQIFSFNSTLCIVLKNTSLHMWAKLAGCPSHTESIRKVISFHFTSLFLFFKQRWKIPQARSRSCLRQRSGSMKKGQERGELWRADVSLEKTAESKFFSLWGELRGALFLIFSPWGCSVMCNNLQLFAQWHENIQSFHPWLRRYGLDWPHSLYFSQSLSNSLAEVKWELHLRQPRLSYCQWLCSNTILTCFHNIQY